VAIMSFRRSFSLFAVVHLVASAATFAVGAVGRAAAGALDAFVGLVLSVAPPRPLLNVTHERAPQTMGLHQARSFTERLLDRRDARRCRAPDSVAFVTA
jgi:hypothetical protein